MTVTTIKKTAEKHHAWVKDMGWEKTNPLEHLALISSEVGEAVNECRGETPTENLGQELADIVLRTFSMAESFGLNIQDEIQKKMALNKLKGNYKARVK